MSEPATPGASAGQGSAAPLTRAQLLARGVVGAGALTAGGVLVGGVPNPAESQPSREQDARILEWLLQVEYLQEAFYTEAERRGELSGELREFASRVAKQERQHVAELEKELGGGNSGKRPEFDFGDATSNADEFIAAAVELEEIAVAAFNGQVANLTDPRLMTAMKIVSVEARHVGWARDLQGVNPAPRPADPGATQDETSGAMEDTGFTE